MSLVTRLKNRLRRDDDRTWVLDLLPKGGVGIEIGVWQGDWTAQLLRGAEPELLHLVDPWLFQPEFGGAWFGGGRARSQEDMDEVYESVVQRFGEQISNGRIELHRAASQDANVGGPVDWIYVDGLHSYEGVRSDLERYAPLLRPGGLLVGDDYGPSKTWSDGVLRAFDEFRSRDGVTTIKVADRQIVLSVTDAR